MKRRASFIGSGEWLKRDVAAVSGWARGGNLIRVIDKPSGIWAQSASLTDLQLIVALAHRVTQLTT